MFFPPVPVKQWKEISETLKRRILPGVGGWSSFDIKVLFYQNQEKTILMCRKDIVTEELHKGFRDIQFKPRPYQSPKMQLFSMCPVNYKGKKNKPGRERPERFPK